MIISYLLVISALTALMPKEKDYARLSILIPRKLRKQIEELAEFPYGTVTNATKVLLVEALEARSGKKKLQKDQITESLIQIDEAATLLEIASKALDKLRLMVPANERLNAWAVNQLSGKSGIAVERLQAIQQGEEISTKELETLTSVLETTPDEVKKTLTPSFSEQES
ncbi:MAG: hypothetical protein F6K31_05025 [Symploca sp. SIO2G7]|nr:hypothetical protein [Symploca sp. SIO2G7]